MAADLIMIPSASGGSSQSPRDWASHSTESELSEEEDGRKIVVEVAQ